MHCSYYLIGLSLTALLWTAPAGANEVAAARSVQRKDTPRSNVSSQCGKQCVKLTAASGTPATWQLHAENLTQGQQHIVVWIQDVETRETLEQQTGLSVSLDKRLEATAAADYQSVAKHPLQCGHTYQAVIFDSSTGNYYYSNSLKVC